ncbi:MAG TPA: NADH-quinone oxidoreductase subunit L [Ferruginibacter sp.]|nr:NADH-quinone oxidoreductase subunit L [Ferruginibacter sp.]HRO96751.1 NADH-quinone oxidoreductase subunit L [Ferruginibacter sp.]
MDKNLLIACVPLLPLLGFLITGLGRNMLPKNLSAVIACGTILASFIISIMLFSTVRSGGPLNVEYFTFIQLQQFDLSFEFKVDQLTSLFLLVITGIGFLIHVYSSSYMHEENSADFSKYFSYLNLFVFSMLLLVMGGNFVVMFIGWEGVGLCSYLLIGYWYKNQDYTAAAKKAFVMNRIGDLGFLLAIFWFIAKVGSVNYDTVFSAESLKALSSTDITGITLLLFVGATGKSAQLPLFTWLPDAMAGPTPVSALIHAATMVTAGIYMIARANVLFSMAPFTMSVILIIGMATMLLAASIALKQNDIKKVLAYSTVSQLGYMFIALGVGAYTAAVFHVITHAFFKALLFLGSGSVIHAMGGEQDMRNMGGLKRYMAVTHITMLIGCLAIAGMPPFAGFFSKDEILANAFGASPVFWGLGVLGAMMTAFYMFRLYAMTFHGSFRGTAHQQSHLHESPAAITIPLMVLAVLSVLGGFIGIPEVFAHGAHWLNNYLQPVFAPSAPYLTKHTISHATEYVLMAVSVGLALVAILYAWSKYKNWSKESEKANTGIAAVLENKWYVDELYQQVIIKPINSISKVFHQVIELKGIDGIVNGIGSLVHYGSRQLRWLQSGQVGAYVLLMVLGILAFFIIQLFL